jgi:MraZ protein
VRRLGKTGRMAVFFGTHAMKIDGKGRVSMPAAFRDALQKSGSPDAVLMPTEGAPVIEGCDRAYVEDLVARAYSHDSAMSDAARQHVLGMLGEMVTLSMDPEGRFVFPAALRTHCGAEDTAIFVGRGRTFQIWHPAKHEAARTQLKSQLGGEMSLTRLFFLGQDKS